MGISLEKTLRGHKFIADTATTIYGAEVPRGCDNCFYGVKEQWCGLGLVPAGKCLAVDISEIFNTDKVPEELDGMPTAHFCPWYKHYSRCEEI